MTFAQRTYFYRIIYFINMKNKTFIYFKGIFCFIALGWQR
jgi:hypothetical protein